MYIVKIMQEQIRKSNFDEKSKNKNYEFVTVFAYRYLQEAIMAATDSSGYLFFLAGISRSKLNNLNDFDMKIYQKRSSETKQIIYNFKNGLIAILKSVEE